jgi:hypothetical protein
MWTPEGSGELSPGSFLDDPGNGGNLPHRGAVPEIHASASDARELTRRTVHRTGSDSGSALRCGDVGSGWGV